MNIGVVNIATLLDESKKGQALSNRLKSIAGQWDAKLEELRTSLAQIEQKLVKTPDSALPEVKMKLLREQELAQMEYRQTEERMSLDIESQRQQFRTQLLSELESPIGEIAKSQGLEIILNSPHPSIAYVSPQADITASVIKLLNQGA